VLAANGEEEEEEKSVLEGGIDAAKKQMEGWKFLNMFGKKEEGGEDKKEQGKKDEKKNFFGNVFGKKEASKK
jgi:hypothetical protein